MSIVIVAFEGAPKVSADAQKREAELDARLEAKVQGKTARLPSVGGIGGTSVCSFSCAPLQESDILYARFRHGHQTQCR